MARHWAPLRDPTKPLTRSRSIIKTGNAGSQWGQRPMFSEPGEDQLPPEQGIMAPEARLDDIHPSDGRQSSDGIAELIAAEALVPVKFMGSTDNVSAVPTDAEITTAFGKRDIGEAFVIRDDGGAGRVILIIKGGGGTWYYEVLTKAL